MELQTYDALDGAIRRATRATMPAITQALWAAHTARWITDDQAEALDAALAARRTVVVSLPTTRRHVGSRPRTPESLERRRRWAAAGHLPPQIVARYTLAEQAVLAVVAAQVREHGQCDWPIGRIAAVAGVAVSTAEAALRTARIAGHILSVERRHPGRRSETNVVTVIAPEWVAWLRLRRRVKGGGVIFAGATCTRDITRVDKATRNRGQKATEDGCRVSDRAIRQRRTS